MELERLRRASKEIELFNEVLGTSTFNLAKQKLQMKLPTKHCQMLKWENTRNVRDRNLRLCDHRLAKERLEKEL
jgi:hypothetical protein